MDSQRSRSVPKLVARAPPPSIRAFPTIKLQSNLSSPLKNRQQFRGTIERIERLHALPILKKYYHDKRLRKSQRDAPPVADQLGEITLKLSKLSLNTHSDSMLMSSNTARKLDCLEADRALTGLIKKCDIRSTVSQRDQDSMRKIELEIRRDTDRMKAFFRKKDRKVGYSDRRKYWVEDPVMTHSQVKSIIKNMRLNTVKTKIYV